MDKIAFSHNFDSGYFQNSVLTYIRSGLWDMVSAAALMHSFNAVAVKLTAVTRGITIKLHVWGNRKDGSVTGHFSVHIRHECCKATCKSDTHAQSLFSLATHTKVPYIPLHPLGGELKNTSPLLHMLLTDPRWPFSHLPRHMKAQSSFAIKLQEAWIRLPLPHVVLLPAYHVAFDADGQSRMGDGRAADVVKPVKKCSEARN